MAFASFLPPDQQPGSKSRPNIHSPGGALGSEPRDNAMSEFKFQEKKRRTKLWIALGLLTVVMLGVSMWLTGPSPPRQIIVATGQEGGGYDTSGKRYQANLGKMGLGVKLVNTNGSIDNLQSLLAGEADVAFVQAGTYRLVEDT